MQVYSDPHPPELSHEETRTAGLVADRLRAPGFEVHEQVGVTGLTDFLKESLVAIRP